MFSIFIDYFTLKVEYKFKAIFSKELRERIEVCGVCSYCNEPNTGRAWCNKCNPGRFLKEGNTSGNREIDKIIYEAQCKTRHYDDSLEWIPYDRFDRITLIGEGGFAKIYSAIWLDGEPEFNRKESRTGPITVALKKLKNPIESFIDEIRIHSECSYANFQITQFYGITKDPKTEEFMMVLAYAEAGNLREYLNEHFSNLKWKDKLEILYNIIYNLEFIHDRNYIHKDLHSGNILQFCYSGWTDTKITDLGLAQFSNSKSSSSPNVYGVLPYMAPEVLSGKPYTFASDIYSFGIIMVEISTGRPPYWKVSHDEKLALAICNGLRPRVAKGTPQCYINLVNQCLDANPDKRPFAKDILIKIRNWLFHKEYNYSDTSDTSDTEVFKEFIFAEQETSVETSVETTIHSEAIYTSRPMNFTNLPKPRNSIGVQIENLIVSDHKLVEHFFLDNIKELIKSVE